MPYTKTTWVEGSAPGISAAELNRLETQYDEAVQSFPVSLFDPFVLTGCTAAINATVANQLDFTGGTAYPKQADNTLRKRDPANATFTTSVASTTYYLDLNPDGTLSWGTAHSAQSNYLPLYEVTTDASANILTVTDVATRQANILPSLASAILKLAGIQPVNNVDVVTTPAANKILKLDASARFPGDIVKTKNVSSTDLNNLKKTGFYDGDNMINAPGGSTDWFYIEVIEHTLNPTDWVTQIAWDFNGGAMWFRNLVNGVWGVWNKIWHSGNLSAARIIQGTYTGDGTTDRLINIGVPPLLVWLVHATGASVYAHELALPEVDAGYSHGLFGQVSASSTSTASYGDLYSPTLMPRIRAASNGFLVSGNSPSDTNYTGRLFKYYALVG